MTAENNHHTLVALDDVLGALVEDGPLTSEALAERLGLTRLDARMVLVDAHAHGLVDTNNRGQWEISERGREALSPTQQQPRLWRPDWQKWLRPAYLGRRGLPIAVGLLVSAGGVAVANSGLPSFSGPPVVAAPHAKARIHAHRRSAAARRGSHAYFTATGRRYIPRSRLIGTVRLTRRLPLWRPYEPRRLTSLGCRQYHGGALVTGRRTRHAATSAPTLIGAATATTGLGDLAAPVRRRAASAPKAARCR